MGLSLLHPQAEELVNTVPLTGVPGGQNLVRLVTVDSGGAWVEVTEHIGCESANTGPAGEWHVGAVPA